MARLLEVSISLLTVLAVIWGGWWKGLPATAGNKTPYDLQQPQETTPSTAPTEETQPQYDPVAGALLICKSLLPYDGPALWEEGAQLPSVAALELWNAGDIGIRYAEVVVVQGDRELRFEATYIPPGGRVVVPEKNGQEYLRDAVTDISYPVVIPMEKETGAAAVSVTENGTFAVTVTNVTQERIACVRIFYKQYDAEHDVCVGGTTYSAVLTDLKPGESRNLMPYRYAAGYAKIVMVIVETV